MEDLISRIVDSTASEMNFLSLTAGRRDSNANPDADFANDPAPPASNAPLARPVDLMKFRLFTMPVG